MTTLDCEYVRDVYPDILGGRADAAIAQSVREHIAGCDDCRAEIGLLEAIRADSVIVPAGLDERVLHAVAQPRTRRWHFSRSDLAMAATLAAAVIGGAIIMETQSTRPRPAAQVANQVEGLGFVGVEDAMMSGKASLDDLSVEELEKLLGEMES